MEKRMSFTEFAKMPDFKEFSECREIKQAAYDGSEDISKAALV